MKESSTILSAFDTLRSEGSAAALATVVHVAGSSYRRPGARMLVAGDGRTWGGVSGGCLERDVIRRARQLIASDRTAVVRYDTTDEDTDTALGCAGVIDIFLEPISENAPGPIPALRRAVIDRQTVALATVIRSTGSLLPATRMTFDSAQRQSSIVSSDLQQLLHSGEGGIRHCDGADIFFELLRPPQSLVIFGGGPDVTPLVAMAKLLGWHVTVIRQAGGLGSRFDQADRVVVTSDDSPLGDISIEPDAAVVVMTHNYPRDVALLPHLISQPFPYLGVLGPRRRSERLTAATPESLNRIYAPVGLDLCADTPETIALAIIAEIQSVLAARPASSLRDKAGPIYPRANGERVDPPAYSSHACPISA